MAFTAPAAITVANDPPISQTAELKAIPWDEGAAQRTVRIRGTVSSVGEGIVSEDSPHPARRGFCVEDESGGIWVATKSAIQQGLLADTRELFRTINYGVEVELVGLLDQGVFHPVILPARIEVLGPATLGPADRVKLSSFLSGGEEMRRATVSGVVQDVTEEATRDNRWVLRIETGIGHFFVRVLKGDKYTPRRLLDSKLEVTGLVTSSRNWRSEFVCPRLIVRRHEDIRIVKPAPEDPFAVRSVPLESLNGYSPIGRPVHRRRVEGTVTYNDKQSRMYIQDNDVGIHVHTSEPSEVRVGDRVEVSGFIDTSRYLAGLRGAVARRIDSAPSRAPVPISIATTDLTQYHQRVVLGMRSLPPSMTCEGRLTQLTGQLLNFRPATAQSPNLLEIMWGESITTALLAGEMEDLLPGTEVSVTGIAKVSSDTTGESVKTARPARVDLILRDTSDIKVLRRPSWWTLQRICVALAMALAIATMAFAWAFFLGRMLRLRTAQLAKEVRNRRDAAIEFQAAMRERTRLAVDLHDTVLQTMAGIAFQIDACRSGTQAASSQQTVDLETASRMARNSQEDLRNVVWALRCLPLEEGTLFDSIQAIARQAAKRHGIKVTVDSDCQLPPLADFVAGNLLLVIQEAIHNAVKHAEADQIHVTLTVNSAAERVSVSVRDNGIGFDLNARPRPRDGHFGIEGMKQRIQRIGGMLAIESEISVGTEIRADIPLRSFDSAIA